MSISLNTNISSALPVSDARTSSVIKRQQSPAGAPKANFSALVNSASVPENAEVVTGEEKQFFAELFPKASEAIRSYGGYSPSGVNKPVQLGTIIDMKG
ncbi:MAG: hypothetical protein KA247_01655 [Bacteroidetes bacterium]|nr:hypothetical protein [Bacteroidota bacterium]